MKIAYNSLDYFRKVLLYNSGSSFFVVVALSQFIDPFALKVPTNFRNSFGGSTRTKRRSRNVFLNKFRNVMKSTEMEMRPREKKRICLYFFPTLSEKWAPQFLECTFFLAFLESRGEEASFLSCIKNASAACKQQHQNAVLKPPGKWKKKPLKCNESSRHKNFKGYAFITEERSNCDRN